MKKYVRASRQRYNTVDEIREDFIKKGWDKNTDFTEATEEDYKKVGFTNYKDGRKRFIMKGTGNWFNDDGEIYFYNIEPAKNPVVVGERIYDSVELSTDISDSSIRSGIIDAIDRASNTDPNVGATTWYELAETSDKIWAFVCAWLDLDSDGEYRLMGKIAYMPNSSAMSDYDYDWMMPELPNGDVADTELEIDPYGDIDYDVDWWVDSWNRIKSEYVDDDIEESTKIHGRKSITSSSSGLRKMTQKQIKDYVRDGVAIDITNYGFDEMDQFLREHNLDKIAISRGTYGMNGGLLQDRDTGEMYAITARNSALMMTF